MAWRECEGASPAAWSALHQHPKARQRPACTPDRNAFQTIGYKDNPAPASATFCLLGVCMCRAGAPGGVRG
jgi:hypothetical protein